MRYFLTICWFFLLCKAWIADAVELKSEDFISSIKQEFIEQGYGEDIELELFGGETKFDVDDNAEVKILVASLFTEEKIDKFTAEAEIFADGKFVGKSSIIGRYFILHEVYVPVRDMEKGEIIKEEDLKTLKVRESRLRDEVLIDKDELLGKQVVRSIKEDKLITTRDIRDEIVVIRGEMATVVYQHKGLQITSKMEASEDGAKGQYVKLINSKSGKEVVGKVIDKNMVMVEAE